MCSTFLICIFLISADHGDGVAEEEEEVEEQPQQKDEGNQPQWKDGGRQPQPQMQEKDGNYTAKVVCLLSVVERLQENRLGVL